MEGDEVDVTKEARTVTVEDKVEQSGVGLDCSLMRNIAALEARINTERCTEKEPSAGFTLEEHEGRVAMRVVHEPQEHVTPKEASRRPTESPSS